MASSSRPPIPSILNPNITEQGQPELQIDIPLEQNEGETVEIERIFVEHVILLLNPLREVMRAQTQAISEQLERVIAGHRRRSEEMQQYMQQMLDRLAVLDQAYQQRRNELERESQEIDREGEEITQRLYAEFASVIASMEERIKRGNEELEEYCRAHAQSREEHRQIDEKIALLDEESRQADEEFQKLREENSLSVEEIQAKERAEAKQKRSEENYQRVMQQRLDRKLEQQARNKRAVELAAEREKKLEAWREKWVLPDGTLRRDPTLMVVAPSSPSHPQRLDIILVRQCLNELCNLLDQLRDLFSKFSSKTTSTKTNDVSNSNQYGRMFTPRKPAMSSRQNNIEEAVVATERESIGLGKIR